MVFGKMFLTNMSSSGSNKYLTSNSGLMMSSYFRNPLNDNYLIYYNVFISIGEFYE